MKKIFVIGGASYDAIVNLDEFPAPLAQTIHQCAFYEAVGSTGIGKAANLCKLDFAVDLQIVTGDDHQGNIILNYVNSLPLTLHHSFDPAGTERHVNLMNAKGQRISIFLTATSSQQPIEYIVFMPVIEASDLCVLNIVDYCRNFIPILKESGKEIWTDLHDYDGRSAYHQDFIKAADVIFLSSDNLLDYKTTMTELICLNKKFVVCTHGSKGASILTAEGHFHETDIEEGFSRIDTNGAGDAFFAGFLFGYSQKWPLLHCMRAGHFAAGACIMSREIASASLSANWLRLKMELH